MSVRGSGLYVRFCRCGGGGVVGNASALSTNPRPGLPKRIEQGEPDLLFTTKPPGSGTGLGLSLCRELVTEMGGALEIRSVPGTGTLAAIELPLVR